MHMFYYIVLVLVFFIIVILFLKQKKHEGFTSEYFLYNTNINGYEEGRKAEYRNPKREYPRGIWQDVKWRGQQYHTRLPWLIEQQYSYPDLPRDESESPVLPDKARLRDLPLNFSAWYYGRVPGYMTHVDTKYWPTPPYLCPSFFK